MDSGVYKVPRFHLVPIIYSLMILATFSNVLAEILYLLFTLDSIPGSKTLSLKI